MLLCAISDDLSGGNDLAGRLAPSLGPVWSALWLCPPPAPARALVLSAETRFLGSQAAFQATGQAWALALRRWSPQLRFQKIDSTLRGQLVEDCAALLAASAAPWMAVLPAYPRAGRVTRGGAHYVHGQRLDRTEFSRDPLTPARGWRVDQLFPRSLALHAPLSVVGRGSRALAAWLRAGLARKRARFVTFDCASSAHTQHIAAACLSLGCRSYAGASDLGGALAERLSNRAKAPAVPRLPWVFVVGSVSATSFKQLRAFEQAGGFHAVVTRPASLKKARTLARQGASVAISSLESRAQLPARRAEAAAAKALRNLARQALSVPASPEGAAWLATGGHSALALYAAAGWQGTWVHGELLPGLAYGRAQGPGGSAWVASKPGGFGQEDLFARLASGAPSLEQG